MSVNFEEDEVQAATDEELTAVSNLANLQLKQEQVVEGFETRLKEAKKALRQTCEQDLPDAMSAANMEMFKTTQGVTIAITENLYASISAKKKPEAIAWLMEHEQSALVKSDVVVGFDKGDNAEVLELIEMLGHAGYENATSTETVNTGSVKSMIKEMLENGDEVPLDLFGAYFHRKSVVKV